MTNKIGITDKVLFLLKKSKSGVCSDEDLQTIEEYTKQHSDDMIIGKVFGYSVSDYAIASLKWINSAKSIALFNEIFYSLSEQRQKNIKILIDKKSYLQI